MMQVMIESMSIWFTNNRKPASETVYCGTSDLFLSNTLHLP